MKSVLMRVVRPVYILSAVTIFQLVTGAIDVRMASLVLLFSFLQNLTYTMLSRARMRTNERYHATMAILSAVSFFASSFFLVTNHMPFPLIAAYVLTTVFGNLQGKRISERIERLIGAVVDLGEVAKKRTTLSSKEAAIGLGLMTAVEALVWWEFGSRISFTLALLFFLAAFANNIIAGALTVARSTDSYWSHLVLVLLLMATAYFSYDVMLAAKGDWLAILPYTAGSVAGSIIGTRIEKKLNQWMKGSYDKHVTEGKKIALPVLQSLLAAALFVPQLILFGLTNDPIAFVLLAVVSLFETAGYTLSSRARTRNHEGYIEWACSYSNGIWFAKAAIVIGSNVPNDLALVYLAASAIGSLWAQGLAMYIERFLGAVMDLSAKDPAQKA